MNTKSSFLVSKLNFWSRLSDHTKYRILEMIPGLLVWTTFFFALFFSFIKPLWVIYFILVFDLLWLIRILYVTIYIIVSYKRFRQALKVNWLEKLRATPRWGEFVHTIFIPTYKEPIEVLDTTFQALIHSDYPLEKFIVILAGEERDHEQFVKNARLIQERYGSKFGYLMVTLHPKDIVGQIAGKGSNLAFAGRQAQEYIDSKGIPYENVIVSSFDADTCVHPQYFSYLTYKYLTCENPTRTSFQPLALFNNNIWQAPAFSRVVSYSTTFWLLSEQVRPERMFTFSSHSMSFKALVEVGFWQDDIVTEDSRIVIQCLIHYDGAYKVEPLYIPLSMDTVHGKNLWDTIKNQYRQVRRWAYGVENFPYMAWNFIGNKRMPFLVKWRYMWNQLEGVYSWATAPILITILGRLPVWIANQREEVAAAAQNAPEILQVILTISMIGIFISAMLATSLLPPRPQSFKPWKLLFMVVQWIFLPVTLIFFGSIPAIEAQTRLMLGKYLGFHVTEKVRKS